MAQHSECQTKTFSVRWESFVYFIPMLIIRIKCFQAYASFTSRERDLTGENVQHVPKCFDAETFSLELFFLPSRIKCFWFLAAYHSLSFSLLLANSLFNYFLSSRLWLFFRRLCSENENEKFLLLTNQSLGWRRQDERKGKNDENDNQLNQLVSG